MIDQSIVKKLKVLTSPSFSDFSICQRIEDMERQMIDDVFVLQGIALQGQATVIYARYNCGKTLLTLHMLIEAIQNRGIDSGNVVYLNWDDGHKDLLTKTRIAKEYGFHMLASGYGINADGVKQLMRDQISSDRAAGQVLVFDTLKKFTDLMDKKLSTEFNELVRQYTGKGGTVIALAHVNKHAGVDGKSVHAGTSDTADDFDCVYILEDAGTEKDMKTVVFENRKNRGDVVKTKTFRYSVAEGQDYRDLLESVAEVPESTAEQIRKQARRRELAQQHSETINEIVACINAGFRHKTELVREVHTRTSESKRNIHRTLTNFSGNDRENFQFWYASKGEKNTQNYQLNPKTAELGANV